jgi:hypothetical protein
MLSFVIILALASCTIEMMLASKIPAWRKAAKKYKIFNLFASLGLSYTIGTMFGAAGLIAMTAAIFSTILSIPGYAFLEWVYDSPQAQQRGGNLIAHHKSNFKTTYTRWKIVLGDLSTIVYKVIRIITFPIWATRACILKYNQLKLRISSK